MPSIHNCIRFLLALQIVIFVFHFLILLKIVPYNIAWGGRIENDEQMYVFEALSIAINGFLFFILLVKGSYVESGFWARNANAVLKVYAVLFLANTLGNLFAATDFEKLFAVITLLFAWLVWRISRDKSNKLTTKQL